MSSIPLKCCLSQEECVHPDGPCLPATLDNFYKHKNGLHPRCKQCVIAYQKRRREVNPDAKREWYAANREQQGQYNQEYRRQHQQERAAYKREYRRKNRDKYLLLNRLYHRNYYHTNKERASISHRRWQKKNPVKQVVYLQRRRARKRKLPDTFTAEQWFQCLEYFNYCCAVCGSPLRGLFGDIKPHADHWIPISYEGNDNPGTVAGNMICLCNSCNSSKSAKMPYDWLKEQFGIRKADEILVRVNAYFESVIPC